jgi:hypothetical protein
MIESSNSAHASNTLKKRMNEIGRRKKEEGQLERMVES